MRWIERFMKFSREQGGTEPIGELRMRFCEGLSSAHSVTPWVLQEINAAIDLFLRNHPSA